MRKFRLDPFDDFMVYSEKGKPVRFDYEMVDPNGSEFEIKRKEQPFDIQEHINSFRDSCDINLLIARFTNGDKTAIPIVDSDCFNDISELPQDIHTIHKQIVDANTLFDELPAEVKAKFDSIDDFYSSVGTDKFTKAFINDNTTEIKESAVEPTIEN